jgi:hypothetical protein
VSEESTTPIFLFSLPRAGSTLVQRILAAHDEVSTTGEPWLLLPYLYARRPRGVYAEYTHTDAAKALEDFCAGLPGGEENYLAELRAFALRLYTRAAQERTRYFLDKTPRYHLVAEDVIRLFPEGRFIFLWRNPLAVVASNMETWAGGRWRPYTQKIDFYDGLASLITAYESYRERVCSVRYEDLLTNPEEEFRRVFDYLDLDFDSGVLSSFNGVRLDGRMSGDPTGSRLYSKIDTGPLEKWKKTLANPVRKAWCRRYLRWIGSERLAVMGYDLDALLEELESVPSTSRMLLSDLARLGYGLVYPWAEPAIVKDKLRLLPETWRVHIHR